MAFREEDKVFIEVLHQERVMQQISVYEQKLVSVICEEVADEY